MKNKYFPNIWSSRQIFRLSGLDGVTDSGSPFWAKTGLKKYEFILQTDPNVHIMLPSDNKSILNIFTNDCLKYRNRNHKNYCVFLNQSSILGTCNHKYKPYILKLESKYGFEVISKTNRNYECDFVKLKKGFLLLKKIFLSSREVKWVLVHEEDNEERLYQKADTALIYNIKELFKKRISSINSAVSSLPSNISIEQNKIAKKAISILRANIKSPEGRFLSHWSNPSFIHVNLNLWDTLFHSFGIRMISHGLAERDIFSLLTAQREDGYIPNPVNPDPSFDRINRIHPPLIGWALWKLYKTGENKSLLAVGYPKVKKFIEWIQKNRDENNNLLLEWKSLHDGGNSPGGESGRDNDVRFDEMEKFDAVDFTGFIGNEVLHLSKIAKELGFLDEAEYWGNEHKKLFKVVNQELWDETDKFYYDKKLDGSFIKIKTNASFIVLLGGLATEERAMIMVKDHLINVNEFWTELPVSSVSISERKFEKDYWRGPVWLCYNLLIHDGLLRYGFRKEAYLLAEKTVAAVEKWYRESGTIFEFYDCFNKKPPFELDSKKGTGRKIKGGVSEFSWSSAVYLYFLNYIKTAG